MIHEHESSQDTETFLKENGQKFKGDCLTAMRLMFSGIRLNGDTCKALYGFSDRRLRNCHQASNMVKKEWKLNSSGKRMYVEYFIPTFKPPTKEKVRKTWNEQLSLSLYESQFR